MASGPNMPFPPREPVVSAEVQEASRMSTGASISTPKAAFAMALLIVRMEL